MERILKATVVVGLSSLLTVAFGAVRYKFIATELGATGVGLLGILTSGITFGVVLFSLGLNTSGVQAAAAASGDKAKFQLTRFALLRGSNWLGVAGGLIVATLGLTLGASWFPAPVEPALMIWMGVALGSMVVSGGYLALLNGTGRIRALAVSNALGSAVGTVVTIAAVFISGQAGLIAALAAAPIATLACSGWFLLRDPRTIPRPNFSQWWPELRSMFLLGGVVMVGLLVGSAAQLIVRIWLQQTQGLQIVGYFQAAWTITGLYLGFVLTALAVEYYPRISKQVNHPRILNSSVDKQIRVALLLGAPVLLWMMVLSPLVLHILYDADFQSATSILRWQLLGDVLKIVGWAIAFLLLARKARGAYFVAELSFNVCYLLLGIPLALQSDLAAMGIAYVGSYAVYVPVTLWLAHRESGFVLQRSAALLILVLLVAGGVTLWCLENGSTVGIYVGSFVASIVSIASAFTLHAWRKVERRSAVDVDYIG
ncbi:hypothetical protein E3O44_13575 [Cryobacterium algoricola]|uniref:Polysaccharide biosynthesis protein n=1 Tax=Cryobacterium algoricola TaxID=1259183 RepID=A0ABY2IAZ4_9MICO|nr:oligosaccharide flippase family protein [Cryobacterium algoricola]TFB85611.1 hypothetical protein E3O44_13575 [Cryobacterium algoricola]